LEKDRRYSVGSNFVFMSRIMNWDLSKLSNYIGYFDNKSIALHVVRVTNFYTIFYNLHVLLYMVFKLFTRI
jgi:hypothetical protein